MTQNLIIFAVLVIVCMVGWRLYWQRVTERIRDRRRGGDGERKRFEVSLARGLDDAPARMMRLLAKFDRHCTADTKARGQGLGSVDVILVATNDGGRVRCSYIIECDEQHYASVKRAVKQAFRGYARVSTPEHNTLDAITEGLRAPKDTAEPPLAA